MEGCGKANQIYSNVILFGAVKILPLGENINIIFPLDSNRIRSKIRMKEIEIPCAMARPHQPLTGCDSGNSGVRGSHSSH